MAKLNTHYRQLKREYIFPIIEEKLFSFKEKFPLAAVVNLGIGDVALPLASSIATAIENATREMTTVTGMRGYGPSEGYLFLREAIVNQEYPSVGITPDEIFISDGTNSDASSIHELFSSANRVAIVDPTYPVYLDANIMAGRGGRVTLLPCTKENQFCPTPPSDHFDLIYLCTPGNPTGVAMNRSLLEQWVAYALKEKAVLLIDNAYSAYVTSSDVPKTVYAIPGADEVAVEFRSFSKSAGFTGLRCAYTVLPKKVLKGKLYPMWKKRQSTKSNGVAYPIQRGAEAALSGHGATETRAQVATYQANARRLKAALSSRGFTVHGGIDAPYLWWEVPEGTSSWEFFDHLLTTCHILAIPGRGFGAHGEGFIRLSAFTTPEQVTTAEAALCALE
jgi:LL-diaminopimelate aminotransferase